MFKKSMLLTAILILLPISSAYAAEVIDSGDTAWMIVATALVMMMTPAGLALFYSGMSRYKNLLNTFAMTFVSYLLRKCYLGGLGLYPCIRSGSWRDDRRSGSFVFKRDRC